MGTFFIVICCVNHLTPCINRFNTGLSAKINNPATVGTTVNIKKKVESEYCSVIFSICPPTTAANLLPIAIAKYHIPNIRAIILAGTSLDTYDNPTGDKHSSPRVWNR